MSYQVVLGMVDAELATDFRVLLEESGEFAVADSATTTSELIEALGRRDADVVVVHEQLGPLPVMDLVHQIGVSYPQVAVVLAVREGTPDVYSSAMLSGARGIVTLPPSFEELQARLTAAAQWSRTVRRHVANELAEGARSVGGLMVAVAGAKGGTGATTLAVHLALAAAVDGTRRVCLVDLDLQAGDVPNLLDLSHRRTIVDLVDVARELTGRSLEESLYVHPSGLRVLLAPAEGERGEDVTAVVARQVLGAIKSRFDVVVVDCGTVVTEANAVAVGMADRVLVTVTPDVPSLRAAKRLARLWGRLQVRREDDFTIVINRASKSSEVQPDLARKVVGAPVAQAVLPASFRSLELAVNTGSPTMLTEGPLRRAIGQLAHEVGTVRPPARAGQPSRPSRPAQRPRALARRRGGESGQVAVESIGTAFLVMLIAVAVWQAVLWGYSWTLAIHAADEGARRLAVSAPVEPAVRKDLPDAWERGVKVTTGERSVRVTLAVPMVLPGRFSGPLHVSAWAGTVREQ